jgi:transcription elongation factor SPT5
VSGKRSGKNRSKKIFVGIIVIGVKRGKKRQKKELQGVKKFLEVEAEEDD